MTLAASAVFGLIMDSITVSFASAAGATLAFLVARYLTHDFAQECFRPRLKIINNGIEQEGAYYLFTLRLIPVIPFFLINILFGLTPIRTNTYLVVSQIGMLVGTIVYVNACTQLGRLDSADGIFSPVLIGSFI